MLITILSAGSRGDTQPYIALGLALKKEGHRVRLAAFENFASFVEGYGLEFYPIPGDVARVAAGINGQGAMKADNPLRVFLSFQYLKTLVFDLQKHFFNACRGADAVVYHPGPSIGYFAARHLHIPAVLATPFPMTPTGDYPALIFYDRVRLGRGVNRITHKIFEQIMWTTGSPAVKQFWKKEFGRAPEDFGCPFPKQTSAAFPTIVSCSNHVFPRPQDWPEHVYNTGYWFLDDAAESAAGWQPPQDLLDFLQSGPPPVYVGFGSVSDAGRAVQTTELVMDALKRAGQRGILATGWGGMAKMDTPADVFFLESAPHDWLFPRMAAVVHHGGAGTTAAGLRAGAPAVIVPHGNDQFAWGRRVYELGVGAKPIPRKDLTANNLADAIAVVMGKEIRAAAQDLGAKIQSEKGAETAAQVIIDCIARWDR